MNNTEPIPSEPSFDPVFASRLSRRMCIPERLRSVNDPSTIVVIWINGDIGRSVAEQLARELRSPDGCMLIDGGSLAMMLGDRALPDADQMAVELACEAVDRHANFVLLAEMARSVDFGPLVRALIASNRPLSVVCVGESAEESVQQNLEGILAPWCDSSIVRNIFLLSETGAFQELEATPGAKLRQAVAHLLSAQRSAEAVPEELENQAPNPSTAEVVAASPPAGVPGDTPVDDDADEFVEVSSGGRVTRIRRPKRKSPKTVSKAATAVAATTSAITDASPASSPPKQPPMPPQPPTTPAPAVPVDESAVRRRREQIDRIKKRNASS